MIEIDKIYNEDCLTGMQRIPDGSVDAIICDLPYGTTACAWDNIIPFEPMWEQFRRVTKPNAAIVLFGSEPFSSALRMSNIKEYRYDWVWRKDYSTGFLDANRKPLKQHENISVFYQSLPTYNPQKTNIGKKVRVRRSGTMEGYHKHDVVADAVYDGNFPTSVLEFKHDRTTSEKGLHPTQKPVDLLRYLILTYTNSGGVVLDATIGSGTTAVAAIREKRHFIGFELNKEYFDIAQRRIADELRQPTLF